MDFSFLQNPLSKKWVINAPRRAKRPDIAKGMEPPCPFCPGREGEEGEVYRVSSSGFSSQLSDKSQSVIGQSVSDKQTTDQPETENRQQKTDNWSVRVIPNKFPFAPIHEVVIHSQDHHKNFDELPVEHVELILKAYRHRYNEHAHKGQVYIFHNRGEGGGESLPHPHSQIAVVPNEVKMDIPRLDPSASSMTSPAPSVISNEVRDPQQDFSSATRNDKEVGNSVQEKTTTVETDHFYLFCPKTSQWPDEVWIAPKERGRLFGEITDVQIKDFAFALQRTIQILDIRHGHEFPFNFYIYPGGDWYLRLMPRVKSLGGFEVGTGIFVNTQDPLETIAFIAEHFHSPDEEKIKTQHGAEYGKAV